MTTRHLAVVSSGDGRGYAGPRWETNRWAKWSAICGLLAMAPLGLAFGAVGLAQTLRRGQRGTGLAVLGVAASVFWLLLLSLVLDTGASIGRNADGSVTHDQQAALSDLRVGDCFNWIAESGDIVIPAVNLVPCGERHIGRVYATPTIPPRVDEQLRAEGTAACKAALVGSTVPAGASVGFVYPSHVTMDADSREVVCYAAP